MIRLVGWDPSRAHDFDRLNREWLERYFTVEPLDELYLRDPQGRIIDKGGEIFFALDGDEVIGCCAAVPRGADVWELAKLGVTAAAQGRGAGRALCEAVIAFVRGRRATRLMLVSNSTLRSALRLYERLGFVHRPFPFEKPYIDADVYMELDISSLA